MEQQNSTLTYEIPTADSVDSRPSSTCESYPTVGQALQEAIRAIDEVGNLVKEPEVVTYTVESPNLTSADIQKYLTATAGLSTQITSYRTAAVQSGSFNGQIGG